MSSQLMYSIVRSEQRVVEARAAQAHHRHELGAARHRDTDGRRPVLRLRPVARLSALVARHA